MNYLEKAVELSTASENCEGDNWTDLVNLCGDADKQIEQLQAEIDESTQLVDYAAKHWVPVEQKRKLEAEIAKLQERLKSYSLLEELSPPDWPRKDFVKHLFELWEKDYQAKNEKLKGALEWIIGACGDSEPVAFCPHCKRPTGISAIVAHAKQVLKEVK